MLKAISIYFIHVSELGETASIAAVISATHFVLNSFLGFALAFIFAKHSKNPKMVAAMTLLSILSFLTHIAILNIVNLFK
ncbi:MAG TPA: hypothetical protein DIV79_08710 [Opitutae bacterium]|nr:hypothetical protein [Opitutaceae bacterium]HCR30083.1 hypothetical protein [Opitutae bacterium]